MKRLVRVVLPFALLLAISVPGTALAGDNTSEVERKWLDFQKTVTDRMVTEGLMTRQDADARIKELQVKFAGSQEDSIYRFFAEKNLRADGKCKDGKCKDGRGGQRDEAAFRVYSMITGKSVESLKKACEAGSLTIWQLADKDGKLSALKDRLVAAHTAGLDAMVKSGVMTEQQRSKIISHLKDELGKK